MNITLVVPTYNESENIPILLEKIFSIFKGSDLEGHVIVVDDNSADKTWKIAEDLKKKYVELEVLRRLNVRGLSSAVLEGFNMAKGAIIGVIDADLSHPPEKIPELVEPILKGEADIVIGSRYISSGEIANWSFRRKIASKLATLAVKGLTNVKDPMSGFFFFKREVIENIELNPRGFKIGLEILVRGKFQKVIEVPIIFQDRLYGQTKLTSKVILDYIIQISELYVYKISYIK